VTRFLFGYQPIASFAFVKTLYRFCKGVFWPVFWGKRRLYPKLMKFWTQQSSLCLGILFFTSFVLAEGINLPKTSTALFRYFGFKVFTASLYKNVPPNAVKDWISGSGAPVPVALSINYHRDFSSEDFIVSGRKLIKENPTVVFSEIEDSLSRFESFYSDIKEGDTFLLLYSPSDGLSLIKNGVEQGRVKDDEFARAYLGIWLSDYSISRSFTSQLLPIEAKISPVS
jgi:hypothetical protein